MPDSRFHHYAGTDASGLDDFTDDELRAELAARLRRDAAYAARREIANRCGPDSARTVPFDTGVVHGPPALPGLPEMRDDLEDADPGWTGDDALVVVAWCDLYEIDACTARILAATDHIGRGKRKA